MAEDKKFADSHDLFLIKQKLEKKNDPVDQILQNIINDDTITLELLENKTQHRTLDQEIQDLRQEIADMYDKFVILLTLDTVQAKTFRECVSKEIPHQLKTHPEMSQKQAVAVAFAKCRKRFNIPEPK